MDLVASASSAALLFWTPEALQVDSGGADDDIMHARDPSCLAHDQGLPAQTDVLADIQSNICQV
jgi:hypothetical protein